METRPFSDPEDTPTPQTLEKALRSSFSYYSNLQEITTLFKRQWNFSKTSGWMEKVSSGSKALLYCIPLINSFKITLAIRESEKDSFLSQTKMRAYHEMIRNAKMFSEGYNLSFLVQDKTDYLFFETFIRALISLRT